MDVMKFEATTLQEALETVKRELGPEAIILQTRKNRRGFGLMSKASIEVTAAVSERSMAKKKLTESKLPTDTVARYARMGASGQADLHEGMMERALERAAAGTRDSVQLSSGGKPRTAVRYAEIDAESVPAPAAPGPSTAAGAVADRSGQSYAPPSRTAAHPARPSDEVTELRRMIEELRSRQEDIESRPAAAGAALADVGALSSPALHEAFELLLVNGVESRHALALVRQA